MAFGDTLLAGDYTYANMGPNLAPNLTPSVGTSNLGGATTGGASNAFSTAAPFLMAMGAVQGAVGAYYQAQNAKYQLQMQGINSSYQLKMQGIQSESAASNFEFNAAMSDINAKQMEDQAQWTLLSGQRQIGQITMRAGKIKSAQKASQAARGITLGYGSTAEEIATTDLMKESDVITINTNTTRAAEAARVQKVNFQNQSLLSRTSATSARAAGEYYNASAGISSNYYNSMSSAVNPWASAGISATASASSIMQTMYRDQKFADYLSALQR